MRSFRMPAVPARLRSVQMSRTSGDVGAERSLERVPIAARIQVHEVPETAEAVLQDLESGTILVVNAIGSAIFTLVDGTKSVGEIAAFVAETLEAPRAEVERDVVAFLERLSDSGLVRWAPDRA